MKPLGSDTHSIRNPFQGAFKRYTQGFQMFMVFLPHLLGSDKGHHLHSGESVSQPWVNGVLWEDSTDFREGLPKGM